MKIFLIILLSVISISSFAKDEYVLPQDIIDARDQVIESKRKLDLAILTSYYRLCHQMKVSEAEHMEMLAYREITGLDCWQLIFNQQYKKK